MPMHFLICDICQLVNIGHSLPTVNLQTVFILCLTSHRYLQDDSGQRQAGPDEGGDRDQGPPLPLPPLHRERTLPLAGLPYFESKLLTKIIRLKYGNPGPAQYSVIMGLVRQLVNRVEEEHRAKLVQLHSIQDEQK